ncbi:MAG: hypothetical protein FWC55_02515 [Firmicutes bacterium]|nr:hypothetical protein [Bacillota bacterium]
MALKSETLEISSAIIQFIDDTDGRMTENREIGRTAEKGDRGYENSVKHTGLEHGFIVKGYGQAAHGHHAEALHGQENQQRER